MTWGSFCYLNAKRLSCEGVVNDVTYGTNRRREIRREDCSKKPKTIKEANAIRMEFDCAQAQQEGGSDA
jgi:hypothetical protein